MTAVIRTSELTKKYRNVAALDHVDLEVQEGAVYALVGQNGAGKTTAIKILMNLISSAKGLPRCSAPIRLHSVGAGFPCLGYSNYDSFPAPHYSSIADYSIYFKTVSVIADGDSDPQKKYKTLMFCTGSEIRLARPELKRQVRIQLDAPNVRLEDFA